ncbi:MAG: transposase [Candidatus Accumulibacter sp.]|nr:transposase [Accumulibacter sp.]
MNLIDVYRRFPTPEAAITHLERVRWGETPKCPYCGAETVARHAELDQRSRWQCWTCHKSFAATVGTIFHRSHVDLQRWFLLITLMLNAKNGLSATQAARDLDTRRPTVLSMMRRIRAPLNDDGQMLANFLLRLIR